MFEINNTTILQISHGTVQAIIGGQAEGESGLRAVFLRDSKTTDE